MMDICTLIVIMSIPAIACIPPQVCVPSPDGTKTLCQPDYSQARSCYSVPPPTYECKRADGTTYTYQVPKP